LNLNYVCLKSYRNEKLKNLILNTETDYETFEKLKIGELAKPLITIILEKNLISKSEMDNLQKNRIFKVYF